MVSGCRNEPDSKNKKGNDMKKLVLVLALAFCVVCTGTASAATATGTFTGYATVNAAGTCTVVGGGGSFSFGSITPPIATNIDNAGSFWLNCPNGTPYEISLSEGGSANFTQRQMSETTAPANKLNYNLYTDNTYATIWGNGTAGTGTVLGLGTSSDSFHIVYTRIPVQATPYAGNYTDTLTITVVY